MSPVCFFSALVFLAFFWFWFHNIFFFACLISFIFISERFVFFHTMVTVQVLGHLKMIDPAQNQSKPLDLCGECPSLHLGQEVDQEILSLT